jgi:DNA-directed RNA polymerase subunit H (RpoH/RPB5)
LANFDITRHFLVPKHLILTKDEEEVLLKKYKITKTELPMIKSSDPAIAQFKPKSGDIVKVERRSVFGDPISYYRVVV